MRRYAHSGPERGRPRARCRWSPLLVLAVASLAVAGCERSVDPLLGEGVVLEGKAVHASDGTSPGEFYYALAIEGVTTNGSVAADEGGTIRIPVGENEQGVFVVHSSCDCTITVRAYRSGQVSEEASESGPHTVARVRFGAPERPVAER